MQRQMRDEKDFPSGGFPLDDDLLLQQEPPPDDTPSDDMVLDRALLSSSSNDLRKLKVLDALEKTPDILYEENKKWLSQYYHDNTR